MEKLNKKNKEMIQDLLADKNICNEKFNNQLNIFLRTQRRLFRII